MGVGVCVCVGVCVRLCRYMCVRLSRLWLRKVRLG